MRVLAIDPGYDRMGIAVLENSATEDTLIYSTCLTTTKDTSIPSRLKELGLAFVELLGSQKPDCVAIESLFFNKNIKTALAVAEARGVILYLATLNNLPVYEFNPTTIKLAVTGYGKSDKKAVFNMLQKLIKNCPKTALDDEYDAVAVGVTCLAQYGRGC